MKHRRILVAANAKRANRQVAKDAKNDRPFLCSAWRAWRLGGYLEWSASRLVAVLGAAMVLAACGHKTAPIPADGPAVKVTTAEVQLQRLPEYYEAAGTVRPRVSATVAAKVMAAILEVKVKAGDAVKAGDVLARLDDRDLRAEYDRARADFERYQALLAKESATKAEFEAVQARFKVSEAALSDATVTAPFDGLVAAKSCEPGDLAAPGRALFTIDQAGGYRLEAEIPERFGASIVAGSSAHVVVDATGEQCRGQVSEVVPATDPASRSFAVKLDLDCRQPLRAGQFGRARFIVAERPGFPVNRSAVHERGQLTCIFVVSEGRARLRLVKTGRPFLDAVEVLSGLQAGERIVVAAEGPVADGQRVTE